MTNTPSPDAKPVRLYDNTRLEAYRKCERQAYFRHIRGFVEDKIALPLAFGLAWHNTMDEVWKHLAYGDAAYPSADQLTDTKDIVHAAMKAFNDCWTGEGLPGLEAYSDLSAEDQKRYLPRTPVTAFEMLYNYIDTRRDFIESCELLEVERPFCVPLSKDEDDLFYVGRLDKVIRHNGRVKIAEHKTTSSYATVGGFRKTYIESFTPNSQVDGYLYILHMLYGDEAKGLTVDAALVHKQHHNFFTFIPVERTVDQLDAWLWETSVRVRQFDEDKAALRIMREEGNSDKLPYLPAFPKKPEACTLYGRPCEYMALCKGWANPERYRYTPEGFKSEYWSPVEPLHLETIGLKEDNEWHKWD